MVDIQTIITCWIKNQETLNLTKEAIYSLKQLNGIKLIIVDNASEIGGGYLRQEADIYIRNNINLGYAPAMNQGLKLTTSPYVAFAENDIVVSPNAFDEAREILDKHNKIGGVHFRMNYYDEPLTFGNDTWLSGKERWTTISFMVWRREALPDGYFDEGFKMANYEDYYILWKMREKGFTSAYTNKACYRHKDSYTQGLLDQDLRQTLAVENREYFKKIIGEYPDVLFDREYPLTQPWRPFP